LCACPPTVWVIRMFCDMRIFPGHAFVARRYEDGVDVVHLVTDLAEPPPLVQGWRAGAPLQE